MENSCLLALLGQFKKGDMGVFPVIFSEFEGLINHYKEKSDAEDTAEELSVFLLELLYKLDLSPFMGVCGDGLSRYIAVSLRNKYIAYSTQNTNYKKSKFLNETDDTYYTEDFLKRTYLKEAFKFLTLKQKAVISLKYIYNYSDSEISTKLNISRQAVNRIKNRAIEVLRGYLL